MRRIRLDKRRVLAVIRWAPLLSLVLLAAVLFGTARALTLVGIVQRERGLVDFGITIEAFGWPLLIVVLALVRRDSTWHSGEALAGSFLLAGPLGLLGAATWLMLPFDATMQLLGPMLLLLSSLIVLIWPAGAVVIWITRRINRRSGRQRRSMNVGRPA
jgi:hypothetical protein